MSEVVDRCGGIAVERQRHSCKPLFSTLDTMRHSTGDYGFRKRGKGLCSAIAKRFVELHGGAITFDTDPKEGALFRLTLPLGEAPG